TLGVWLAVTTLVCASIQFISLLLGAEISILDSGLGRSLLVGVALLVLIALMTSDSRPLTEFGLWIETDWSRQLGRGALIGLAVFAGYHLAGWLSGGLVLQLDIDWSKWARGSLETLATSVPVAATQQVIFSGFLLSLLAALCRRSLAVLICGVVFATVSLLGRSGEEVFSAAGLWLSINLTLLAMLLATLRLQTGSILMPTGILAGALVVRRSLWKSHLLTQSASHPLTDWFALGGDTRQGPLLAVILLAGSIAAWERLRRLGESRPAVSGPALSAEFKKFVPFSNILALAPLDLWLGRLQETHWRVDPIYWLRLAWVLTVSTVNTLLTWPERLLAPRYLKHPVPDPVLIVGVHRSGTTHLHNLLALDPQFSIPRNSSVLNPHGALVMGWLITPLLGLFMTMRRPMDAMRVHLFSAQEEEFAIAALTRCSPYWGFMFPRETARHDRFIFPGEMTFLERQEWCDALLLYLRKLTFWRRRTPLLKSPYNTPRVGEFRKLFPQVKVIHICRNPYQTYLSNMHLAEHGLAAFQLQDPQLQDNYRTRFLDQYRRMCDAYYAEAVKLPAGHAAEIRYEDLTADPVQEIRRLYAELGLSFTLQYETRLRRYLASLAGYTKNRHPQLDTETQAAIDDRMGRYLTQWGYARPAERQSRSRAA
ncbi:MAG: sulfotransferase family protein, partial [Planctomycetaceae bacterium]